MTAEAAVSCADVVELLPAIERVEQLPDAPRRHVEQCLRCQAETACYRRMRRCLSSLAQHPVAGQSEVIPSVRAILPAVDSRARRLRESLSARTGPAPGTALADRAAAAAAGAVAALAGGIAIAAATRRALRVRYRLSCC